MAFLDDIGSMFGLGTSGASGEAAGVQSDAFAKILPMLQQQLGLTQGQFDPFISAGTGTLPALQEGFQAPQGTTAGGMGEMINKIMGGDAFSGLVEERQRGVQGQLASSGLRRSGTAIKEAAAVPTDIALQLENMLFGRQTGAEQQRISGLQDLARGGQAAAGTSGGLGSNILAQIMQAMTGKAEAQASGILGEQQEKAGGLGNLVGLVGSFFSDPRLKKNIKYIGKIGELNLVEWEWIDELDDSFVKDFPTMGYLSTQVKEFYPEHVHEFGGYDVIDYKSVNERVLCH